MNNKHTEVEEIVDIPEIKKQYLLALHEHKNVVEVWNDTLLPLFEQALTKAKEEGAEGASKVYAVVLADELNWCRLAIVDLLGALSKGDTKSAILTAEKVVEKFASYHEKV